MYSSDFLLPPELKLDDSNILYQIDFVQHVNLLFELAYKSFEKNRDYLRAGKDASVLNDNLQYIFQTRVLMTTIEGCLKCIDNSIIYIRKFYDRTKCDENNISYVDFVEYHTDMFNYKLSTIKDLSHKLVLHIYNEPTKEYEWKIVKKCITRHGNQELLNLYDEAFTLFKHITAKRHSAAHDGKSNINELYDLDFIESARMYCKEKPDLDHDDVERLSVNLRLTKGHEHLVNLTSARNNLLRFLCRYYHCLNSTFSKAIKNLEEPCQADGEDKGPAVSGLRRHRSGQGG